MSIVLPKRQKHVDMCTASSAIQRAKDRFGKNFVDSTLLECSRNAIELTKLIDKCDKLEKKKMKNITEITRAQEHLLRTLKGHLRLIKDGDLATGTETFDGKRIPPGFRFHSNGELKASTALSKLNLDVDDDDDQVPCRTQSRPSSMGSNAEIKTRSSNAEIKSKSSRVRQDQIEDNYVHVDYDKEIRELEKVLFEIYKGLLRSRIELYNTSGGSLRTYLRGHKNEYTPAPDTHGYDYESPNDRFAFKPGSSKSEHLYKKRISCPTHRSCIGCQFKLKHESETTLKVTKRGADEVGKIRWNYVPQGKYIKPSTTTLSTISLNGKTSASKISLEKTDSMRKPTSGPSVRFQESDINHWTKSEKVLKTIILDDDSDKTLKSRLSGTNTTQTPMTWRCKSAITDQEKSSSYNGKRNTGKLQAERGYSESWMGRSMSVSPTRAGSSPGFSRSLIQHNSRMDTLKVLQVIWASSGNFGTYRKQRRIRRACASAQSR